MKKNEKNTVMALFQSKIGWKSMRQRENENYLSFWSLPDTLSKTPKKKEKN